MLSPFARFAYAGPTPLFLFDANAAGTGKTLLTQLVAHIVSGHDMAATAMPRNDDEFRKRITSIALAGDAMMLLDNAEGRLGCPSFNAALTATVWSDRVLKESRMVSDLPLTTIWYATANNAVLDTDTVRRTCHCRIEAMTERPEQRTGFKYSPLLEHLDANRPGYVAACLTILSAYIIAGKPDMKLPPMGSFEGWSGLVRNAIVWVDQPDPVESQTKLATEADEASMALRGLLSGLELADPDGVGMTSRDMLDIVQQRPEDYPDLAEAVKTMSTGKDGKPFNPQSLGMRLNHARRKVVGGRYLDRLDKQDNVARWVVRTA